MRQLAWFLFFWVSSTVLAYETNAVPAPAQTPSLQPVPIQQIQPAAPAASPPPGSMQIPRAMPIVDDSKDGLGSSLLTELVSLGSKKIETGQQFFDVAAACYGQRFVGSAYFKHGRTVFIFVQDPQRCVLAGMYLGSISDYSVIGKACVIGPNAYAQIFSQKHLQAIQEYDRTKNEKTPGVTDFMGTLLGCLDKNMLSATKMSDLLHGQLKENLNPCCATP